MTSSNGYAYTASAALSVDWAALSVDGLETLRRIALPLACGLSEREVAAQLGERVGTVRQRLERLRLEIECQN